MARALAQAERPLTMSELEQRLVTMDKSGVFRTLTLFRAHHMVHSIDSGEGTRYELCRADAHGEDNDRHVHFHCVKCQRTICLPEVPAPVVELPDGFQQEATNCVVEGVCPSCAHHHPVSHNHNA